MKPKLTLAAADLDDLLASRLAGLGYLANEVARESIEGIREML